MNSTWFPPGGVCTLAGTAGGGHGRSTGHSASGNLRPMTGVRTDLLQAPGRMLGLMQTTLFFMLHRALPKPSCV